MAPLFIFRELRPEGKTLITLQQLLGHGIRRIMPYQEATRYELSQKSIEYVRAVMFLMTNMYRLTVDCRLQPFSLKRDEMKNGCVMIPSVAADSVQNISFFIYSTLAH